MSGVGAGWYYDSIDGDVIHQNLPESFANVLVSYYYGPYPTAALAVAEGKKLAATGAANPAVNEGLGQQATNTVGSATNVLGLTDIGDFFHRLTESETWIRAVEVALGGILVYAALRASTSGSSTVGQGARSKITAPVRKTAKVATTVAAPEVRYGARMAAKRAAPKTTKRVASHRAQVAKYGQRKPYRPPEPRPPAPPRVTYRHSTITHIKKASP